MACPLVWHSAKIKTAKQWNKIKGRKASFDKINKGLSPIHTHTHTHRHPAILGWDWPSVCVCVWCHRGELKTKNSKPKTEIAKFHLLNHRRRPNCVSVQNKISRCEFFHLNAIKWKQGLVIVQMAMWNGKRRVYGIEMPAVLLWTCLENEELFANCTRLWCGKVQQVLPMLLLARGDLGEGNANKLNNLMQLQLSHVSVTHKVKVLARSRYISCYDYIWSPKKWSILYN